MTTAKKLGGKSEPTIANLQETKLFVTVPEVILPNGATVPSFQVGQYACTQNKDGQLSISAKDKPWVQISYYEARKVSEAAGLNLITELQYLALAFEIAKQDINWTGGKFGVGSVYQGLHKFTAKSAQAGKFESSVPEERRWHQLSNGEVIYDIAGNCFSWVFDNVQGNEEGLVSQSFAANSPSLTLAPFPSSKQGVGSRPDDGESWAGYALIRGGYWRSGSGAGVFCVEGGWPELAYEYVGFRCTSKKAPAAVNKRTKKATMIDHLGLPVSNFKKSRDFYFNALAPLGINAVQEGPTWALIGKEGKGEMWIGESERGVGERRKKVTATLHIAFSAEHRAQVDAFYTAALLAGGKDNGAPCIREQYHPHYYAAFVTDPDGHNIEAVCHKAEI